MKVQQFRLDELAHLVKGELIGEGSLQFSNLASLENAEVNHLTFVNGDKYLEQAKASRAGAFIVTATLKEYLPEKIILLLLIILILLLQSLLMYLIKSLLQKV